MHLIRLTYDTGTTLVTNVVVARTAEEAQKLAEKEADKVLRKGIAVTWPDGRRQVDQVCALRTGSAFVYSDDGEKIRVCRTRETYAPDGTKLAAVKLKEYWMSSQKYWND